MPQLLKKESLVSNFLFSFADKVILSFLVFCERLFLLLPFLIQLLLRSHSYFEHTCFFTLDGIPLKWNSIER